MESIPDLLLQDYSTVVHYQKRQQPHSVVVLQLTTCFPFVKEFCLGFVFVFLIGAT